MTAIPCAFCGWIALYENEDGTLNCLECVWEWPNRDDYLSDLLEHARDEWKNEPAFIRRIMSPAATEERFCHAVDSLVTQALTALWRKGIRSV